MVRPPAARRRQHGAILILFLLTLPILIGTVGFLIDLSRLQARKAELQVAVDAAALAAAKSLQTLPGNYAAASTAAIQAINYYDFQQVPDHLIKLQATTVSFGLDKDGSDWRSAAAAGAGYRYVKVDSLAEPNEDYGKVDVLLVHALASFANAPLLPTQLTAGAVAVAGPLGVNVGLHQ